MKKTTFNRKPLYAALVGSAVAMAAATTPATAGLVNPEAQKRPLILAGKTNPCNPCAAKKHKKNPCNPCNPCAAKKHEEMKKKHMNNPCNPCAAKKHEEMKEKHMNNPCNPCAAKKHEEMEKKHMNNPCNPCNPCAAKKSTSG